MPDEPVRDSVDNPSTAADSSVDPGNALIQLHSALSDLDRAIYDALRALDRVFGRPATDDPKRPLPLQEISNLREHLRKMRSRYETSGSRRSIIDIAGDPPAWAAAEDEPDDTATEQQVGVAPTGRLKID